MKERHPVVSKKATRSTLTRPRVLEFFAGSGLVGEGIRPHLDVVWANDICEKKARTYAANHGDENFVLAPIETIKASSIPDAEVSWASFPCQDLSLAGNIKGIKSARSGLVWQWLRIMDELEASNRCPRILVAENVVGLVSADQGSHYVKLHRALRKRGFRVGVILLDAIRWLPQSRPRVFVVAVHKSIDTSPFETNAPSWCHSPAIEQVAKKVKDWIWWDLPEPRTTRKNLDALVDFDATCHDAKRRDNNLAMIPDRHLQRVEEALDIGSQRAFPGYKRTRNGRQVLELRFDGAAGCLRTPQGGSSRQYLVLEQAGQLETRLLTTGEVAGLMGARKSYRLPGSYNDAYKAMGDAVAVPVVRYLAKHLLSPLAQKTAHA